MAAYGMITAFQASWLRSSYSGAHLCRLPPSSSSSSSVGFLSLSSPASSAGKISQSRRVLSSEQEAGGGGGLTYKDAGVDIDAGTALVDKIKAMAPEIGSFGGIVHDEILREDDVCLVHGTDGVGTKLKLAFETGIHDTIGIDLVAMNVNDIVTCGAKPLSFQDYFSTSRLDVDIAVKVIQGIRDGCQQSGCSCKLSGGETAEMPDFYKDGEYDLGGSAVGAVKKDSIIDGKNIAPGDVIIGLPSSGVHSNGFSLVRRVLADTGVSLKDQLPGGEGVTFGEALMVPTVIYVNQVLDLISKGGVNGVAHITGGGFTENIPRVFPKGLGAVIYKDSWEVPPVFKWIQKAGRVEEAEMRRTFNMGIGMVLVVSPEASHRILEEDGNGAAYKVYRIGEVVSSHEGVIYV
ncbi:phosphoribosylformylglycinamidine cyclo-ligase, chloroplastic/mitochondrial-like [Malus sylvestris]|uniref:phosphoribosylformylglycinamidine cyclo-ligase, chloroplastic/mitochondrial-like n=1 Tax=Malus sylvestris TaxID=3752 RepID=UPI0021ABA751|nr:phosphoribosylformylglycinamidine cyclo-ligase, chloroplastic/mitochondrial-like [Malus sylvestris]